MSHRKDGWARTALKQQLEIFGEDQVSLDSLWRAVASPSGHDPRRWSDLAAPLVSGFAAYLNRIEGDAESADNPSRILWVWNGRLERPVAHRRPDEPRIHRLGLCQLPRSSARKPGESHFRNICEFVI